jgi:hypothetical protein
MAMKEIQIPLKLINETKPTLMCVRCGMKLHVICQNSLAQEMV